MKRSVIVSNKPILQLFISGGMGPSKHDLGKKFRRCHICFRFLDGNVQRETANLQYLQVCLINKNKVTTHLFIYISK